MVRAVTENGVSLAPFENGLQKRSESKTEGLFFQIIMFFHLTITR